MKSKIKQCPQCQETMYISEYKCPECETVIRGKFLIDENGDESKSMLDRLTEEDKYFVLVFLQTGGKIQDVERVMGISYPTVKARLNDIQNQLKGESGDWDNDEDEEDEDDDDDEDSVEDEEFFDGNLKREINRMKHQLKRQIRLRVRDDLRNHMRGVGIHIHGVHRVREDAQSKRPIKVDVKVSADVTDHLKEKKMKEENKKRRVSDILDQIEKGNLNIDDALGKLKGDSE